MDYGKFIYKGNCRCNICNVTSLQETVSDYGDFSPGMFVPDPAGYGYLCYDCASYISDTIKDWEYEDPDLLDEDFDEEFYFDE